MPSICSVCNRECSGSSGVVKCNGECDRQFHASCLKGDVDEKKIRSGKLWKCKQCRPSLSTQGSVSSESSTEITKEFLARVLDEFKKDVFSELKIFRGEMNELTNSMQFLSDKVDNASSLMHDIKNELASLKKENNELRAKTVELNETVYELHDRVRALEQYTRRTNIEISGIPETPKEDITQIVKDVGAALGVEVRESEITAAHRIPSFKKDRTPSLVVQFYSKVVRDSWVGRFREKKGQLTANKVNSAFPKDKVFVNEHLSPDNKRFLAQLKRRCHDIGYSYVWCRDGKFFVRRANGERCYRVKNYADMQSLK